MTENELLDLTKHIFETTPYLTKEDAIQFAKLSLRAYNNEMECYSDELIEEDDLFESLGKFDLRFKGLKTHD